VTPHRPATHAATSPWPRRLSKVRAALAGGLRALAVEGVPGSSLRIPLAAHRRYWAGPMGDADLIAFLAAALPRDGVFLDVGANIGVYSVALAAARGGWLRGAAFEPVPETHRLLEQMLALNGLEGFVAERLALSGARGMLRFSAARGGANNFALSGGAVADGPVVTVDAVRLDDWVGAHPELAPDAVKIDVEGYELEVLKGGAETLARRRPPLVVKCHCASWPELGVSAADVERQLRGLGYRTLEGRGGGPVNLGACRETVQVLCTP